MFGWLLAEFETHILACFYQHLLILKKYLLVKTFLIAHLLSAFDESVELGENCLMKPHGTQYNLPKREKQGNWFLGTSAVISLPKKNLVTLSWLPILHWRNCKMYKVKGDQKQPTYTPWKKKNVAYKQLWLLQLDYDRTGYWKFSFAKHSTTFLKGMAAGLFFSLLLQHKDNIKFFFLLFLKFKTSAYYH